MGKHRKEHKTDDATVVCISRTVHLVSPFQLSHTPYDNPQSNPVNPWVTETEILQQYFFKNKLLIVNVLVSGKCMSRTYSMWVSEYLLRHKILDFYTV